MDRGRLNFEIRKYDKLQKRLLSFELKSLDEKQQIQEKILLRDQLAIKRELSKLRRSKQETRASGIPSFVADTRPHHNKSLKSKAEVLYKPIHKSESLPRLKENINHKYSNKVIGNGCDALPDIVPRGKSHDGGPLLLGSKPMRILPSNKKVLDPVVIPDTGDIKTKMPLLKPETDILIVPGGSIDTPPKASSAIVLETQDQVKKFLKEQGIDFHTSATVSQLTKDLIATRNIGKTVEEVYDDVKNCRYIRGYDPPVMSIPEDTNKFVFGNSNDDLYRKYLARIAMKMEEAKLSQDSPKTDK